MCKTIFFGTCLLICLQFSHADRRIIGGQKAKVHKRYVVYFLKADASNRTYDAWLCGGAIVSPEFIVTSAACVEDVQHMYAIAGYNKYVNSNQLREDKCLKFTKKKIVLTCVPKVYQFDFDKLEKWASLDIAVVKVESPYNFDDKSYEKYCDYAPNMIEINYNSFYQNIGTQVMVFGWGHSNIWRLSNDSKDYNEKYLHYASTVISSKEECKKAYSNYGTLFDAQIDANMICTDGLGTINDAGIDVAPAQPRPGSGCSETKLLKGVPVCVGDNTQIMDYRRQYANSTEFVSEKPIGICQNDHGGPLVHWRGTQEILIGVASVFRIDSQNKCAGPFLYASTECNREFLTCIIYGNGEIWNKEDKNNKKEDSDDDKKNDPSDRSDDDNPNKPKLRGYPGYQEYMGYMGYYPNSRRSVDECDLPLKQKGYKLIRRHISWANHPDGPAENERKIGNHHRSSYNSGQKFRGESFEDIVMRPQLPING